MPSLQCKKKNILLHILNWIQLCNLFMSRQDVDAPREYRPRLQIRRALPHRKVGICSPEMMIKSDDVVCRLNSALEEMLTTSMGICQVRDDRFCTPVQLFICTVLWEITRSVHLYFTVIDYRFCTPVLYCNRLPVLYTCTVLWEITGSVHLYCTVITTSVLYICQTRKELFGQLFEELIRQEMIACKEKGMLLLRIRTELKQTLMSYQVMLMMLMM